MRDFRKEAEEVVGRLPCDADRVCHLVQVSSAVSIAQALRAAYERGVEDGTRGRIKISIPTETMEQEFQTHYRRGYEAGLRALKDKQP